MRIVAELHSGIKCTIPRKTCSICGEIKVAKKDFYVESGRKCKECKKVKKKDRVTLVELLEEQREIKRNLTEHR